MRGLVFALALLATPVVAEGPLDPADLPQMALELYKSQGADASFRLLDGAVREARAKGRLNPDWSIVFAMLADDLRNNRANPAYALRLADEGLSLARQGGPEDQDYAQMLDITRAYALADLGRLDEAAAVATLAVPFMRVHWGDQAADELAGYAAEWSKGRLTAQNSSALDLARQALDRADKATDRSDHMAVLTEASRAILPPDAGFPAGEVAILTAEARGLAGRALYLMKRTEEAKATLAAGAAALYGPGWVTDAAPKAVTPIPEEARNRLTELFYWLARAAFDTDDRATLDAALPIARALNGPEWRTQLPLIQLQVATRSGEVAEVDRITASIAAAARGEGDEGMARLAEFYGETSRAGIAPTWDEVDKAALARTARAAIATARPGGSVDAGFVEGEAAGFLVPAGSMGLGLMLLRNSISALTEKAALTGPAADVQAVKMRQLAELYLTASLALDTRAAPQTQCPDEPGRGCVLFEGQVDPPRD